MIEVREHIREPLIDSIVSNQLLIGLHCIALDAHPHKEFEWSPSNHRLIAHSYRSFTRTMIELMMIRGISDSSSTPWLPNELMFEIFRALFDLYYRQP